MTVVGRKVRYRVEGVPVPQGSKIPGVTKAGVPYVRESNDKVLRPWRNLMKSAAKEQLAEVGSPLRGALRLTVEFRFPMIKTAPRTSWLRGWRHKETTPDYDKLLRAVGDSIKAGGLIRDDGQFAAGRWAKIEIANEWTGVEIMIEELAQWD